MTNTNRESGQRSNENEKANRTKNTASNRPGIHSTHNSKKDALDREDNKKLSDSDVEDEDEINLAEEGGEEDSDQFDTDENPRIPGHGYQDEDRKHGSDIV